MPVDIRVLSTIEVLPDVVAEGLAVLFVGINPSLYSAEVGHHFARPGNRFWPTLHGCGMTPRLLAASEDRLLPSMGGGLTNLAPRPTAQASQLSRDELRGGSVVLESKVARLVPRVVAFVGITAYRIAFARPKAVIGPQVEQLAGRPIWALPNPSGRNAHYQLPQLIALFGEMLSAAVSPGLAPFGA